MLKRKPSFLTLGTAALMLSACATTYDPAEVCTAEWIAPRVDRAVMQLERDTNRLIKTFKSAASSMEDGKISAWNTYRMISSVEKYADRVENSRGMKDLRILSDTCDDPQIIRNGFANYLESVQAPSFLVMMLRDMDDFDGELLRGFEATESSESEI